MKVQCRVYIDYFDLCKQHMVLHSDLFSIVFYLSAFHVSRLTSFLSGWKFFKTFASSSLIPSSVNHFSQ